MKAMLCKSLDGPEALKIGELPDPEPAPGEAVIKVSAVSLNFLDTLIVRGKYQVRPELPFSPGGEIAGTILKVGPGVTQFRMGERVLANTGFNGCREQAVAPAESLIRVPDGLPDEIAASIPIAYGTALHALEDRGHVKPGDVVLVLGATGGTGLAAVEVATRMGAHVIAAGTSDEKLAICKDAIRGLTGGKGADVIYDAIGGPYAEPALRAIAWEGRYLVIGFAAGDIPKIPLNLLLLKGCDLVGVFWGRHVQQDRAAYRAQMARLMEWACDGAIRPHIDHVFPLEQTGDAIKMMEERKIKGKVVVKL